MDETTDGQQQQKRTKPKLNKYFSENNLTTLDYDSKDDSNNFKRTNFKYFNTSLKLKGEVSFYNFANNEVNYNFQNAKLVMIDALDKDLNDETPPPYTRVSTSPASLSATTTTDQDLNDSALDTSTNTNITNNIRFMRKYPSETDLDFSSNRSTKAKIQLQFTNKKPNFYKQTKSPQDQNQNTKVVFKSNQNNKTNTNVSFVQNDKFKVDIFLKLA